jgi:hypothetical protein
MLPSKPVSILLPNAINLRGGAIRNERFDSMAGAHVRRLVGASLEAPGCVKRDVRRL